MSKPDEAPVLEGWVTASEVADALGISRQHVNRMIKNGEFETLHLLGERPLYVIKTSEVDAKVEARQERAGTS